MSASTTLRHITTCLDTAACTVTVTWWLSGEKEGARFTSLHPLFNTFPLLRYPLLPIPLPTFPSRRCPTLPLPFAFPLSSNAPPPPPSPPLPPLPSHGSNVEGVAGVSKA